MHHRITAQQIIPIPSAGQQSGVSEFYTIAAHHLLEALLTYFTGGGELTLDCLYEINHMTIKDARRLLDDMPNCRHAQYFVSVNIGGTTARNIFAALKQSVRRYLTQYHYESPTSVAA